jgi:cysteine desulfurase
MREWEINRRKAPGRQAVLCGPPRRESPRETRSTPLLGLLFFQDAIDRGIEKPAIGLDIDAPGIGRAFHRVQPALAERIFTDECDFFAQHGISPREFPVGDAVDVRDRLESLDGAENVARFHRIADLLLKLVIHHFTEHPRGKFRVADPTDPLHFRRDPEMRGAVKIAEREVRDEVRAFVENCGSRFHGQLEDERGSESVKAAGYSLRRVPHPVSSFPMRYFDHNATSPLCAAAREAWLAASEEYIGNPSSPHRLGSRAEVALDAARARLAERLGCDPHEIIWTSGATESINTAIHHFGETDAGDWWISAIEHPAVLRSARRWGAERLQTIPVSAQGIVDLAWIETALRTRRPALIAVMAVNNESGVIQPWREVLALCEAAGVPLLCDAAQWIGKLPAQGLGKCHVVAGCAHKFGGPQGVGFLKVDRALRPLLFGGEQEDGRRAGTENVAGVLAMMAALESRELEMAGGGSQERDGWRSDFVERLAEAIPACHVVGGEARSLWNTVSIVLPEIDCRRRWVVTLDKAGFAASTGSACASGKEKPSHVLEAMGFSPALASRVIRFSSGWMTEKLEWDELLDALVEVVRVNASSATQDPGAGRVQSTR